MKKYYFFIIFFFTIACFQSFSQSTQEDTTAMKAGSLKSGTIASQFEYINSISNNFQEYKVIKRTNLDQLRSNVMDSLDVFKNQLVTLNQKLAEEESRMQDLEAQTENIQQELLSAQAERDSFSFLGMPIHKAVYNSLMWTIVALLGAALLFFLFKYSQSHKVIALARKDLGETVEEFEQHRKNTLDRERKLKRELVDALNGKAN